MKKIDFDNRRDFLVTALGLGLYTGINAAGILQPAYALGNLPDRLPKGRSIYKVSGIVTVDGQVAHIKTQISSNAKIQTGNNSEVIFVVGTDAFMLRSNSQIEFDSSGLLIESMRIISGAILSVFGKRESTHNIITSTATIGIRGTGIYIESEAESTYVCTCYGHTRVTAKADPNVVKDIVTKYHDEPVYVLPKGSQGRLIRPAPVRDHTDYELNLIESLVGRETPYPATRYKFYE